MAEKKRKETPQEKVKREQAAKRRVRDVKGQFAAGAHASGAGHLLGPEFESRSSDRAQKAFGGIHPAYRQSQPVEATEMTPLQRDLEKARGIRPEAKRKSVSVGSKKATVKTGTGTTRQDRGVSGDMEQDLHDFYTELKQEAGNTLSDSRKEDLARAQVVARYGVKLSDVPSVLRPVTRVANTDIQGITMLEREANWRTAKGLFTNPDVIKARGPIKGRTLAAMIRDGVLPHSMVQWIDEQRNDSHSPFNAGINPEGEKHGRKFTPGAQARHDKFAQGLEKGMSVDEAMAFMQEDNRGQRRGQRRGPPAKRITGKESQFNRYEGRSSRYAPVAPSEREFSFGASAASIDSAPQLREKFPDKSDRDLFQMQQYQRMAGYEALKNQRWAHETRRANVLGHAGREAGSDRVVIFTTNIGQPAVSLPSDSLIGQYIIGRRKRFLKAEKLATPAMLKGKFPAAVRDMHVIEAATGVSLGAEGAWGAFQKSGWRVGKKKSTGYGKPVPVGAQVMYDSSGSPMYNSKGEIRFTPGATRQFRLGTDRDVGLRIFVG